jgi:transcriptional regulator with XRE-family HTH domain
MTYTDRAIHRRRLKVWLETARNESGLSREEAAARLDWSLSKLVRIENGDQGVSVTDLKAMLQAYEVVADQATVEGLVTLARGSREQPWWAPFRSVISKNLARYLSHESSAASIKVVSAVVPGLLHTEDYAAELLDARIPERAKALVAMRKERQRRVLDGENPAQLHFIMGEEALARQIGGPRVMRRQLLHLLEVARKPNVTIQVIPFSAGAHPGLHGPFILLTLRDSADQLVFIESAAGDFVDTDDKGQVHRFTGYFEQLRVLALPEADSRELIKRYIDDGAPPG